MTLRNYVQYRIMKILLIYPYFLEERIHTYDVSVPPIGIYYIVLGEGENSFLQLVQAIELQIHSDIKDIPGIAYRHQHNVRQTQQAKPIENIDRLPNPAQYFDYQHVAFTRGCPGNCAFCGSPQFWDRHVRHHSPDYFVDQLIRLNRKGISFFYFSDDTFTFDPTLVQEICQKIIEKQLNISWVAIARVNHIRSDILTWMRLAGCIQIIAAIWGLA